MMDRTILHEIRVGSSVVREQGVLEHSSVLFSSKQMYNTTQKDNNVAGYESRNLLLLSSKNLYSNH